MKRYYLTNPKSEQGFDIVTEEEWNAIIGNEAHKSYASQVYHNEIFIDEVPEEFRETVQNIVQNKIARWGTYESQDIPDSEALNIITGGSKS